MDLWTPDDVTNAEFKIKLVDFGADGIYSPASQGGDDTEHELVFNAASTPALGQGTWITFDLPLSDFTNLTTQGHMAQYILSANADLNTLFIDNVLFRK